MSIHRHDFELNSGVRLVNELLGDNFHAEVVVLDGTGLLQAVQQNLERIVNVRPHGRIEHTGMELKLLRDVQVPDRTLPKEGGLVVLKGRGLAKPRVSGNLNDAIAVRLRGNVADDSLPTVVHNATF